MANCNNISAGQTEVILSVIYWICCKLVTEDPEEEQKPHSKITFQEKFGERTIE